METGKPGDIGVWGLIRLLSPKVRSMSALGCYHQLTAHNLGCPSFAYSAKGGNHITAD